MQMNPYLSFDGTCEEAFKFYERCFGGQLGPLFPYAGTLSGSGPADWHDPVMHSILTVSGQTLMGGDVPPERYEAPKGFSLSLQLQSVAEAERVCLELSRGGKVVVPLERTFWAARFGMVVDRFKIPWLIDCEESPEAPTS